MTNTTTTNHLPSGVVAQRHTADNIHIHIYADGVLTDRVGGIICRMPVVLIWAVADDLCLYDVAELPRLAAAARKLLRRKSAPTDPHEAWRLVRAGEESGLRIAALPMEARRAIAAGQRADLLRETSEHIMHCRSVWCRRCRGRAA